MIEIGVHIFIIIDNIISRVIFIYVHLTFLGSYFIVETYLMWSLGKWSKSTIVQLKVESL